MSYGKLIGGKMVIAPNVLNKDGKQYINPPEWLYLEYGYLPLEYTNIPDVANGYHLVQSWDSAEGRLVQRWGFEADEVVDNSELKDKINKLEELLTSLKSQYATGNNATFPEGDYMNPIQLAEGGLITVKNKWYYVYDKDRPHMAIVEGFVRPIDFNDKTQFYFV